MAQEIDEFSKEKIMELCTLSFPVLDSGRDNGFTITQHAIGFFKRGAERSCLKKLLVETLGESFFGNWDPEKMGMYSEEFAGTIAGRVADKLLAGVDVPGISYSKIGTLGGFSGKFGVISNYSLNSDFSESAKDVSEYLAQIASELRA